MPKDYTHTCGCVIHVPQGTVTINPNCERHRQHDAQKKPEAETARSSLLACLVPVSIQEGFARRPLEKRLEFNLNAARAHEKNGVPRGHGYYVSLHNECAVCLDEYAAKFLPDKSLEDARKELYSKYPAMDMLRKLATKPAAQAAPTGLTAKAQNAGLGTVVIGVFLAALTFGVMSGLFHAAKGAILKLVGG